MWGTSGRTSWRRASRSRFGRWGGRDRRVPSLQRAIRPQRADLLEHGCGGGVRFFAHHARATGMDLSFQSLRRLDGAYHLARAVPG